MMQMQHAVIQVLQTQAFQLHFTKLLQLLNSGIPYIDKLDEIAAYQSISR